MEECGRGAAVEQLTARGILSIPAMGDNSLILLSVIIYWYINPRDGGAIGSLHRIVTMRRTSIPAMGGQ